MRSSCRKPARRVPAFESIASSAAWKSALRSGRTAGSSARSNSVSIMANAAASSGAACNWRTNCRRRFRLNRVPSKYNAPSMTPHATLHPSRATASSPAAISLGADSSRAPAVMVNAMTRPNSNSSRLSDGSRWRWTQRASALIHHLPVCPARASRQARHSSPAGGSRQRTHRKREG